ncbi:MAG: terminase family protein [bacterium]|nr:terminase family protein [bacterium]
MPLQNLHPAQKTKLKRLVAESQRRLLEEQIRSFRPVEPSDSNHFKVPSNDQKSFFYSPAAERWAIGGNRSGKTHLVVADAILFATGRHPVRSQDRKPPVFIRFCAPSYEDSIKRVILKKFKQLTIRSDLRGGSFESAWSEGEATLYFRNGSIINFKSFHQDVNKFAGDDLDAAYSDEHGGRKYYQENKMRLIDRSGFFVSSMTPESGSITWEKKHLKKRSRDADLFVAKFSTYGNPYLSPEGIKEVEASISDPRLKRVKLYGDFVALAGLVFDEWDENVHYIKYREIPASWPRVFSIDPHMKKETAMVWAAWSPENELFIYRCAKEKLTVPELKAYIKGRSAGERIQLFLGDEAMGGDGLNIFGEESVLKQLNTYPDRIPVVPTNQASSKAYEAGIYKVREMLHPDPITGKCQLYVMDTCPGVRDEFEEFQFIPDMPADEFTFRERIRKVDDDYLDDIRYIAMAGPVAGQRKIVSALEGSW